MSSDSTPKSSAALDRELVHHEFDSVGCWVQDTYRYIRWALGHMDRIRVILDVPERMLSTDTWQERGDLACEVIQTVTPILGDLQPPRFVTAQSLIDIKARVLAEHPGVDWKRLLEIIKLIIRLVGGLWEGK